MMPAITVPTEDNLGTIAVGVLMIMAFVGIVTTFLVGLYVLGVFYP